MSDSPPDPGAPPLDPDQPAGGPLGHVLLVEDDEVVAEATIALVESFGWSAVHAPDADSALELIEAGTQKIDVVLADIAMPGEFDGMEMAVHLRRMRPELRVVLMTGYATQVHRAAWDGFELLPKPCAPSVLARTLLGKR